jgi:hypothetical protein
MFALLTGVLNFCFGFLSPQLGNFYNRFIGVAQDNLTDLWKLCLIETCSELFPIFFITLIPTRENVEYVQIVLSNKLEEIASERETEMKEIT